MDSHKPLGNQINEIKSMVGPDLCKFFEASGFVGRVSAGQMLIIPAGHIVLIYVPTAAMGYRWSFHGGVSGEEKRVHTTVAAMVETFPALSTTKYKDCLACLQAECA